MTCQNSMSVCALRLSRLNDDGTFVGASATGALARVGGIGHVTWTPSIQAGDDIAEVDGCGGLAVSRKYPDLRKRYDLEIDFITTSAELFELLAGATLLTDGGDTVGYAELVQVSCGTGLSQARVCVEAWGENVDCDGSLLDPPYAVHVFPNFIGTPDARTLQKGVNHVIFKGPVTAAGSTFGNGPFNDLTPLVGVTGWDHAELHADALPSVDGECGYIAQPTQT
jgi:hypothetical protein